MDADDTVNTKLRCAKHTTRMTSEQIRVSERNWKALNAMKDPGESFDDVIGRIIEENDFMKFMDGELNE